VLPQHLFIRDSELVLLYLKKKELLLLCTPGGAYPLMFHLL